METVYLWRHSFHQDGMLHVGEVEAKIDDNGDYHILGHKVKGRIIRERDFGKVVSNKNYVVYTKNRDVETARKAIEEALCQRLLKIESDKANAMRRIYLLRTAKPVKD